MPKRKFHEVDADDSVSQETHPVCSDSNDDDDSNESANSGEIVSLYNLCRY